MKELIKRYVFLTGFVGLNPTKKSKLATLFVITHNTVLFVIAILQFVLLVTKNYNNFITLIFDIVLLLGVGQELMKNYTLFSRRDLIKKVIDINFEKFWTFEFLTEEQFNDLQQIFKLTKLMLKIYLVSLWVALGGLIVSSYLKGKHNLLMNIWLPESHKDAFTTWPSHEIFFAFESYILGIHAVFALVPGDSLFIIFVVTLIGQLRIMKIKLHTLSEDASPEENKKILVEVIQQHNLCFEYLGYLERIYSNLMLLLLACNMMLTAINIYALITDSTIGQKMEYAIICLVVYFQIFIFCFMGQIIQDETQLVADAAYDCKWEIIPDKNIRFMLIMIILRAQKYVNMTMGGLLVMNLETFTRVSRTTLSFLTLMLNMK